MYIYCRGNVFTEQLPSNINIHTHILLGGIYEVRRSDWLRCHDIQAEFHNDMFRHLKVNKGAFTDIQTAW
jgi:hypothetical protein